MNILATDLDRTLLPNGNQEYDGSMGIFRSIIQREPLRLIYVTGRNLILFKKSKKEFNIPLPDYLIGDVGTKIFKKEGKKLVEDKGWVKEIALKTKSWNLKKFKQELSKLKGLRIQEKFKQNQFKLSYYIDDLKKSAKLVHSTKKTLSNLCKDAIVIYSVDETINQGLLDILPKHATKISGIEYIRKKLNKKKENVVYCGDSGNDILPLTWGYKSILVRNAIKEVRDSVKKILQKKGITSRLYPAKGYKKLNGYYVSGIIEGLIKFRIISEEYAE